MSFFCSCSSEVIKGFSSSTEVGKEGIIAPPIDRNTPVFKQMVARD
ncbi:hypothetical protein HG468_001135 [Candidatus Saccharibacteria bacterium]|nr:hypothetical protein [Candidatus Saccharibacteria bacterium]